MILDLTSLFEQEGTQEAFCLTVDLSAYQTVDGARPLHLPVKLEGMAANTAGVVLVEYHISYTMSLPCDRCLEPTEQNRAIQVARVAVRSLEAQEAEPDGYFVLPDARLDFDEMVYADVVLDLPGKNLCREDCLGLCPICGLNLNRQPCGCSRKTVDPRLQILADLLE